MSDGDKPVLPEQKPGALSPRKVVGAALAGAAIGALAVKTATLLKTRVNPELCKSVSYLLKHVGPEVTAYLAGAEGETELIDRWLSGEVEVDPVVVERLRYACDAVRWVADTYDGETAQAWLFGMNEWLRDEAPAYVLGHGDSPETWGPVVEAAQAFVGY